MAGWDAQVHIKGMWALCPEQVEISLFDAKNRVPGKSHQVRVLGN